MSVTDLRGRFQRDPDEDDYEDYLDRLCHHGNVAAECDECDAEIWDRGGIDKCMNCGRYRYGDELTRDQVCKIPCRNPNEH